MAYDRSLIAPFNTGLQTDLRPFLIMDDAFQRLNNAYVFRGRVRKRFGSTVGAADGNVNHARVALLLGNTDGSGNKSGTAPGHIFKIGQQFIIGNEIFTVTVTGTPGVMLTTGASTVHTYNTTSGAYVINGAAANTPMYFYPAEPIMGIAIYENGPVNAQPTFVFDTQYVYQYNGTQWLAFGPSASPFATFFHGDNTKYFWDNTWQGLTADVKAFFVTNYNANTSGAPTANDDPMYVYTGSWAAFTPQFLTAGNKVVSARIIMSFKNRLLLLNTIEQNAAGNSNTTYLSRCRFSQNGSPLEGGTPLCATAWLEQTQTGSHGAGFIDATTEEAIISAEFIKDRLIVYFERSTWELVYTGNEVQPFVWQKINTELGSEATFSSVPFDKVILTVGNTGIHACNGANVERVDNKIPDQVFNISDKTTGVLRVAGIRDYFNEMVYWTFPSDDEETTSVFCSRVLVYNYQNGSWAFFDDSITAFGYFFGTATSGQTWAQSTTTWAQSNFPWNSGSISAQFRQILAGNQEGFLFTVNNDVGRNAPSLQISAMANNAPNVLMTVKDHNLVVGDWVAVENAQGSTNLNGSIVQVVTTPTSDTINVGPATITGTYTGGGTLAKVSNIDILSKQWNPYLDKGVNFYLAKIDFGVFKTSHGAITVDWLTSASQLFMIDEAIDTNSNMGNNVLETSPYALVPLEQSQDRVWHPVYFQGDGTCVQLNMYLSSDQISNPAIAWSDFELEGMVLHTMTTSRRIG